jgi:hypothetical protein
MWKRLQFHIRSEIEMTAVGVFGTIVLILPVIGAIWWDTKLKKQRGY